MQSVQFYPSVASQVLAAQANQAAATKDAKPPVRIEVEPRAPFDFSYTKVRLDTGEPIWRWPLEPRFTAPQSAGAALDIVV